MCNYLAGPFARVRHILVAHRERFLIGLIVIVGLVVLRASLWMDAIINRRSGPSR